MTQMTVAHAMPSRAAVVVFLSFVVIACIGLPAPCWSAPNSPEGSTIREEVIPLAEGGTVRIENFRGSTHVNAWPDGTVRVVAEKKGSKREPISPADLILMSAGSNLVIQCKQTGQADRIDLTVYVPNRSSLIVAGGAWPVEVNGSLTGAVVETTSGEIGYKVPAGDQVRVALRSSTGVVRTTLPLQASERSGYRNLQGVIGAGAIPIFLNSHSGNITLVPAGGLARATVARSNRGAVSPRGAQPGGGGTNGSDATFSQSRNARGNSGAPDPTNGSSTGYPSSAGSPASEPGPVLSGPSGTADLAGNRSSQNSDMKTKVGPFSGERDVRRTDENSTGLGVHIIPSNQALGGGSSNQSASGPRSSGSVTYDPGRSRPGQVNADDPDVSGRNGSPGGSGNRQSAAGSAGSSGSAAASGPGGAVDLGGNRSSQNSDLKTKVGPFSGEREVRETEENSLGAGVHIIPSGQTSGQTAVRRAPQSYPPAASQNGASPDNRYQSAPSRGAQNQPYTLDPRYDASRQGSSSDPSASPGAGVDRSSSRPPQSGVEASNSDPAFDLENTPRRESAPTLGRNNAGGRSTPSAAGDGAAPGGDDDAIVLKSALVNLNVSVTDRAGKSLTNLRKEDFEVLENGRPQPVQFFAPATAPFNLVLLLDLSGSIYDKIAVVKSAALHFLDTLEPQDRVAVITFTRRVGVLSYLTSDRELLRDRIKNIQRPEGGTAFYEAMWFTVAEVLKGTQGQRNAIVVMTDGVDNSLERRNPAASRVSFQQLAHRLEESDAIVFPVYLDTEYEEVFERGNSSSEAYVIAQDQLQRLADVTGGWMFRATEARDLKGVYSQVAAVLRTVYSVGYQPTNPERDGSYRRVRVEVVNQPDVAVRTRKGYFAQ